MWNANKLAWVDLIAHTNVELSLLFLLIANSIHSMTLHLHIELNYIHRVFLRLIQSLLDRQLHISGISENL